MITSDRFRQLRKEKDLSLEELGRIVGSTINGPRWQMSRWEKNPERIPAPVIPKIATALGITVEEFLL